MFKYLDEVRIKEGFYKDICGKVIKKNTDGNSYYTVKFLSSESECYELVLEFEGNLELIKEVK